MGLNKSKRKIGFTIGDSGKHIRNIGYISYVDTIDNKNATILFSDENGEYKKVLISIEELIMTKSINIRQLSALIDKKTK